jgi:pyruvate kinase
MSRRRTKLVCTIGPASRDRIDELVSAGMDVARLNFSHGTDEERELAAGRVRSAAAEHGRQVALLADLPGPKVRLGEVSDGEIKLEAGEPFRLLPPGAEVGDEPGATTNYARLADDLRAGDRILLADGAAELRVSTTDGETVHCEVNRGGVIRSGAGVNIPSERLRLPAVTDRDRRGLERAARMGVDFVAQSFVRSAADVRELRALLGGRPIGLMAKIETRAAVDDLDAILAEVDAVMLARGDLGVEMPYEQVPMLQKQVVRASVAAAVPVVVATQMLESMVDSPRPTRAEATDVANAVLEGADAVMLSAETAIGAHPILAARTAVEICRTAEEQGSDYLPAPPELSDRSDATAVAAAAVAMVRHAVEPPIRAIACFTRSGLTARLLSAARPTIPIFALSPDEQVVRRLALWRAVVPIATSEPEDTDAMIEVIDRVLRDAGLDQDARVVMVGSIPFGRARTNFLKLHRL